VPVGPAFEGLGLGTRPAMPHAIPSQVSNAKFARFSHPTRSGGVVQRACGSLEADSPEIAERDLAEMGPERRA
jgi:hypothetical protein